MKIPVAKPYIGYFEKKFAKEAINEGWISSNGKYIEKFENGIKIKLNSKNCVVCSNGTVALVMALQALGVGAGDEVIVPDVSFAATINSVINIGAKPVITEIDKKTWCIDTKKVIEKITKKTKAIICVHLYGNPCDMGELLKIKKKYNLFLIEDAAESFGSKFKNKYTGTIGDVGCISFFGNKTISTGEGGCCLTNNNKIYKKLLLARNNGIERKKRYFSYFPGLNFKMTNIQAAIGYAQLKKMNKFFNKRNYIEKKYDNRFKNLINFSRQKILANHSKVEWLYTILIRNNNINKLIKYLDKNSIETRRIFYPFHQMPIYKKYVPKKFDKTNSNYIFKYGISLPTFFELKDKEINKIINKVIFFQKKSSHLSL
ncbi:DegT/DnrJ/EryC1/StrS family aminotransferase [Pelagibacterales bacterium SAG-MED35]|nr:DegT/DnrJ/EryC1/StrS family aminotransferase [Pelagibacterales bacterium SAG-MED35]